METDKPFDLQILTTEKDKDTQTNDSDLVSETVFVRVNENRDKGNTKQRRCGSVSTGAHESSGTNRLEQGKSGVRSEHAKRGSNENKMEQNLFKGDSDSITAEIAPEGGSGVKLQLKHSSEGKKEFS